MFIQFISKDSRTERINAKMSHGYINEEWEALREEPNEKKRNKMLKKMERENKKWIEIYGHEGGAFESDFDVQWATTRWWRNIWPLNHIPIWWF